MGVSRPLTSGRSFLASVHDRYHTFGPRSIKCRGKFSVSNAAILVSVVLVSLMLILVRLTKQQIAVNIITQAENLKSHTAGHCCLATAPLQEP